MKRFLILGLLILSLFYGCDKVTEKPNVQYVAQIVGFDLNCNTCIVSFPYDSIAIKESLGASPDNYYRLVNLDRKNYFIGQKLLVEVRKAVGSELEECEPLEAVRFYNYLKLFALDYKDCTDCNYNDTIEMSYKQCVTDVHVQYTVCLDSVINDSRCPDGAVCCCAGEAIARFEIKKEDSNSVFIDMNEGMNDVVVGGLQISFLKLSPHPSIHNFPQQMEYKALLLIK
jgi:hypothetical protein